MLGHLLLLVFAQFCSGPATPVTKQCATDINNSVQAYPGGLYEVAVEPKEILGQLYYEISCHCASNDDCNVNIYRDANYKNQVDTISGNSPIRVLADCPSAGSLTWNIHKKLFDDAAYQGASISCGPSSVKNFQCLHDLKYTAKPFYVDSYGISLSLKNVSGEDYYQIWCLCFLNDGCHANLFSDIGFSKQVATFTGGFVIPFLAKCPSTNSPTWTIYHNSFDGPSYQAASLSCGPPSVTHDCLYDVRDMVKISYPTRYSVTFGQRRILDRTYTEIRCKCANDNECIVHLYDDREFKVSSSAFFKANPIVLLAECPYTGSVKWLVHLESFKTGGVGAAGIGCGPVF